MPITTIAIETRTREQLKEIGRKGETYDKVISELVELAKEHYFYESQVKILKTERFVPLEEV